MGFVMFNGKRLEVFDRNHYVRVFLDGSRIVKILSPEEIEPELSDDKSRPEAAVFLNGTCVQTGNLSMDSLIAVGRSLMDQRPALYTA